MRAEDRIFAFISLGNRLATLPESEIKEISAAAKQQNAWFTEDNIKSAIDGLVHITQPEAIKEWLSKYNLQNETPRMIGIVMAGNIPLVGFHDLMCVLLSGNTAAIKTSSHDSVLIHWVVDLVTAIEPRFKKNIEFKEKLTGIDAVIATGSDNTARYFEYYFRNIPHIIRKNRTSIAILKGNETTEQLALLGRDVFLYFGLGCRNVSKVLVPEGYKPDPFFESISNHEPIIHHHKYRNNYDYNKAIYLVNKETHLDNGFLLWRPSNELVSPISVLFVQEYQSSDEVTSYLDINKEKIQCIVGEGHIPFGKAQSPEPWDYADNVDTLDFLMNSES